ncbi:MAG: hypothetical protein K0V04_44640 [Deltaproteobacteria bacterium]|nr:hypothetical protein [Deltaproteobacteria bacterium]
MTETYDQDEAALILAKVAEMQKRSSTAQGLSLSELEQAAQEAGLDGTLVREAAMQVERTVEVPRGRRWFGAGTRVVARARTKGPLDFDALANRLFGEMAGRVGEPGVQHEVGDARVWHTNTYGQGLEFGGPKLSLTIRPAGDGAELVLRKDVDREAARGVAIRTAITGLVGALTTLVIADALGPLDDSIAFAVLSTPLFSALGWVMGKKWWQKEQPRLAQAQRAQLRGLTAEVEPPALAPADDSRD